MNKIEKIKFDGQNFDEIDQFLGKSTFLSGDDQHIKIGTNHWELIAYVGTTIFKEGQRIWIEK